MKEENTTDITLETVNAMLKQSKIYVPAPNPEIYKTAKQIRSGIGRQIGK